MSSVSRTALSLVRRGPPFAVLAYSAASTTWGWAQVLAPSWVIQLSTALSAFPWGRWRFFVQLILDFAHLPFITKVQLVIAMVLGYTLILPFAVFRGHLSATYRGLARLSLEMLAHAIAMIAIGPLYVLAFRIIGGLHRDDFTRVWIELVLLTSLLITPDFLNYFLPVQESHSVFQSVYSMFAELFHD